MGTLLPLPKKGTEPPIFNPFLFWPTAGYQDGTLYRGRPGPSDRRCVRWGPAPPSFRLLWPNGWMDKDFTWYRSRPQLMPHCVQRRPMQLPSPRKGHTSPPLFGPCLLCPQSPISATADAELLFVRLLLIVYCEIMRCVTTLPLFRSRNADVPFSNSVPAKNNP